MDMRYEIWTAALFELSNIIQTFVQKLVKVGTGEVTQWLAPRTSSSSRLVVRVWLWAPMIHWSECRWRSAKGDSLCKPPVHSPNVQEIVHEG